MRKDNSNEIMYIYVLYQILNSKDDAMKVLHSICQQICQQWP